MRVAMKSVGTLVENAWISGWLLIANPIFKSEKVDNGTGFDM
jgi:hypothetical protein